MKSLTNFFKTKLKLKPNHIPISRITSLYDSNQHLEIVNNIADKKLGNEEKKFLYSSIFKILSSQVKFTSFTERSMDQQSRLNLSLSNVLKYDPYVVLNYKVANKQRFFPVKFYLALQSYYREKEYNEYFYKNGRKFSKFQIVLFLLIFYFYFGTPGTILHDLNGILITEGLIYRDYRLDDETEFAANGEKEFILKEHEKSSFLPEGSYTDAAYNIIKPISTSDFQIATNVKDRLTDVKGIDEIKDEIGDIVKMLKEPKNYEEAGAKLVKGILLMGKPGTGKTLLARALAGESGVNFIYCNGADFDKAYVGQGNNVIKNLFKQARAHQPCIIFIDEIDSLLHKGRRQGKYSSSNDRSLINTFLAEMDGFKQQEYLFVLGATNSEKDLDSAAIRPGRFDKLINVPLPDSKGREEIFDLYLNKIQIKLSDDISSKYLSKLTPGFSGAEIENLVNHAIIEAVDKNVDPINKDIFEEARDRVLTGIKRKINKMTLNKLIQTAVHESGHALTCYLDEICKENIHKVTIIPRGTSSSKSYSLSNDAVQGTKEELYSFIDKSLGGLFAEEIYFSDKSKVGVGCGEGDLERATSLAKSMIKNYGMSKNEFGLQVVNDSNYLVEHKISEETRDLLDSVVVKIINERSAIVKKRLMDNSDKLKLLAKNLIEYEELSKSEMDQIFEGKSLLNKPKKNSEVIAFMENKAKI